MEKKCGKKYLLSLIWRDSLHIKRALIRRIHDSKERLEEREREYVHTYAVVVVVVVCFSA